jgi:hypothetical protein
MLLGTDRAERALSSTDQSFGDRPNAASAVLTVYSGPSMISWLTVIAAVFASMIVAEQ